MDVTANSAAAGSGLGEALVGAASEMVGDAVTLVGDTVMDGLASVGTAVADAAIGVATDAAIGSGALWGVWDGLHRVLPNWLFSGGAVVLGGEVAFALFALSVASSSLGENENDANMEGEKTNGENLRSLANPEQDLQPPGAMVAPASKEKAESPNIQSNIPMGLVLSEVESALQHAAVALEDQSDLQTSEASIRTGDLVEIIGGKDYRGQKAAVLSERGVDSGFWYLEVEGDSGTTTIYRKITNLRVIQRGSVSVPNQVDTKEVFQRTLLEARILYDQAARVPSARREWTLT